MADAALPPVLLVFNISVAREEYVPSAYSERQKLAVLPWTQNLPASGFGLVTRAVRFSFDSAGRHSSIKTLMVRSANQPAPSLQFISGLHSMR